MNQRNCHWCGDDVPALKRRIAELEQRLEQLEIDNFTLGNTGVELADECIEKDKQNARLRELLRECREYVPVDLQNFIDAELAEGE